LEVPYDQIPADALRAMIEEFVTRDGTDYGEEEVSLEEKVAQMMSLLQQDKAVIWFDEITETLSIFHREAMQRMNDY